MNKKGQVGGVVTSLVFGIATLIVGVIVAFVVVANVGTVDDTIYTTIYGGSVVNETVTGLAVAGDNLAVYTYYGCAATVSAVINASNNVPILSTDNYTVTNCNVSGITDSPFLGYNVKVTYTYTYQATSEAAENMQGNFTSGIDNISGKVPTVLLIAAIVLILSVLAVLTSVWMKMRSGGASL